MIDLITRLRSKPYDKDKQEAADLLEWRPIETAPKDGTRIIVINPVSGAYVSHFDNGEWPLGFTHCGFGQWFPQPTHWLPLPSPPQENTDE